MNDPSRWTMPRRSIRRRWPVAVGRAPVPPSAETDPGTPSDEQLERMLARLRAL
jgi:hypothetical protein